MTSPAIAASLVLLVAGCTKKQPPLECPDLEGDSCVEHEVEEVAGKALCDSCGAVWICHIWPGERDWSLRAAPSDRGCECLNDSGFLDEDLCPWEY